MEKPKIFQIVLLGVFAVFILIGLLAFSGKLPLPTSAGDVNYGSVTLWGTLPASVVSPVLAEKLQSEKGISIKICRKKQRNV
jgi:hypothetical protein